MNTRRPNAVVWCALAFSVASCTIASLCTAQTASDASTSTAQQSPDTGELAEVVVTATKRAENELEVPISIGVLTDTQLQQQQVSDLNDLAHTVPDLAASEPSGTLGQGNFSIRGVSGLSVAAGSGLGQTTIGVYLDDVALSTVTGAAGDTQLEMFDVNRVEVLRGPQGTLYGASAMGGTIRYVSNQPDLTHAGWSARGTLSATQGGNINWLQQAVGNVPLIDNTLALRIGAQVTHNSGFINNYNPYTGVTEPNDNYNSSAVIRVSMKYQSSDNSLTILPAVFLQRYDANDMNNAIPGTHFLSQNYVQQEDSDRIFVPSLTIDKDFHSASLTSATAYFWRFTSQVPDGTPNLEIPIFSPVVIPTPFPQKDQIGQVSEELRLTSATQAQSGLPFDWIIGAYYSDNHVNSTVMLYPQNVATFQQMILENFGSDVFGVFPYGANIYTQLQTMATSQISGFGEFNYTPIKFLTATVGLRYLRAHQTETNFSSGFYNGLFAEKCG